MRFIRFISVTLVCAALPFAAVAPRLQTGYDSIQAAHLKADLTFLSSDALEGRRSLQKGDEAAVQWIASEFAKAGLKPLVGDSYLQPVPIIEYDMDRDQTTLAVHHGQNATAYHAPDITVNFPNETTIAAPVVFAGYGITAPELNYDDYAGIDVHGKAVLIFNHEPQESDPNSVFNGTGNTRFTNNNYKILNAQRHGAVAVLSMPDPNHPGGAPNRGAGRQGQGRAQQLRIPFEALTEGHTAIPLFTVSAAICADLLGKQPAEVQTGIDRALRPASFEISNTRVELHPVVAERRRGTSWNVAGLIEGRDPALRSDTIVFSGHHDHNGVGPNGVFHGADDNGSGTVGVVELAHAFAANPEKPKRSLLFIVFAAEERGLLGAYYYVSHPLRPIETTRAQINFDMIGRNETATPSVQTVVDPDTSNQVGLIGTHYSPDYREVVERANKTVGLNITYKWDRDAPVQILFRSDQYPFLLRDVPAIWWFTGFHPDYHQVTDTVEKINFSKMEKILKLAYLSAFEFGDMANGPRFQPRAMAK